MAALGKDFKHGEPWLGHAQAAHAQKLNGTGLNRHVPISAGILDWFKKSAKCVLHDTILEGAGSST